MLRIKRYRDIIGSVEEYIDLESVVPVESMPGYEDYRKSNPALVGIDNGLSNDYEALYCFVEDSNKERFASRGDKTKRQPIAKTPVVSSKPGEVEEFKKVVEEEATLHGVSVLKRPSVRYSSKQALASNLKWSKGEVVKVYTELQDCCEADMFSKITVKDPTKALYSTAVMLHKINLNIMTPRKMYALVHSMNQVRCNNKLDEDSIYKIARDAYYSDFSELKENSNFKYVFNPELNMTAAEKSVYIGKYKRERTVETVMFILNNWDISESISMAKVSERAGLSRNYIVKMRKTNPEIFSKIEEKMDSIREDIRRWEDGELEYKDAIKKYSAPISSRKLDFDSDYKTHTVKEDNSLAVKDLEELLNNKRSNHKLDGDWDDLGLDMEMLFKYFFENNIVPETQKDGFGNYYYQVSDNVRWYKFGYILGEDNYKNGYPYKVWEKIKY